MGSMNDWAVLVAAAASVAVGMVWYADPVLGKAWRKLQGMTGTVKPAPSAFVIWGAGSFVLAYTISRLLMVRMVTPSVGDALVTGILIAVGIVIAGMAPSYAFAKKPLALLAIELGYVTVSILLMSAIVAAWG